MPGIQYALNTLLYFIYINKNKTASKTVRKKMRFLKKFLKSQMEAAQGGGRSLALHLPVT